MCFRNAPLDGSLLHQTQRGGIILSRIFPRIRALRNCNSREAAEAELGHSRGDERGLEISLRLLDSSR